MNSETIIIVDAPTVTLTENENAGDALLKFYRELGWNGTDILDPCKIRTTKSVYNGLYDIMFERCPDPVGIGMLMVNRGPGTDERVPMGKVCLLDGWITPAETQEGVEIDEYQQQAG